MSEWTHILGIIRFDSWSKNVSPNPIGSLENIKFELSTIYSTFYFGRPEGSEGPLEVNSIVTDRGPTLMITGDLRDFGREDIPIIIDWLNSSYKNVRKEFDNSSSDIRLTTLRDVNIRLYTEEEQEDYYIFFDFKKNEFECYTCDSYVFLER